MVLTAANPIHPNVEPAQPTAATSSCPLIVKTSKQWILPPRPKPGRKPIPERKEPPAKEKPKKKTRKPITTVASPVTHESPLDNANFLLRSIKLIELENLDLKADLLSLIHDYKHLKDLVLNKPHDEVDDLESSGQNVHKRSYTEVEVKEEHDLNSVNELIDNLSELSYGKIEDEFSRFITYENVNPTPSDIPAVSTTTNTNTTTKKKRSHRRFNHYKDFEKLDTVEDSDLEINFEDDDEEIESPDSLTGLSRTTSPSLDFENNTLMSTLTRSTTVSSVNTVTNSKPYPFKTAKFFELPRYEEEQDKLYMFQFDEVMTTNQDRYNMVNDFLEEKLLTNDLNYYVGDDKLQSW